MKNILLLVHDDEGQEARIQAALDLTRALDGHLTCIDVAELPIALEGDYYSGAGQAALTEANCEREANNKAVIEKRLANEAVSWTWLDTVDSIAAAVVEAASLSDLIVLNRKLEARHLPNMHEIASNVVMQARKPVVAVPETITRMPLGRALIAWDGQSSCEATVRACVPLLALAEEVEIFTIRDGSEGTDPTEAAEYLSRHGIHATVQTIDDSRTAKDKLISEECARWSADYVVMGAYGRGRLMETFGGVTKRMLATSERPIVFGH